MPAACRDNPLHMLMPLRSLSRQGARGYFQVMNPCVTMTVCQIV